MKVLRSFNINIITFLALLTLVSFCKEKAPDASDAGSTTTATTGNEQGKKIFSMHCASCHGAEGAGDGLAAANLNPKPRNFQSEKLLYGDDIESIKKTIANGSPKVPTMTAFKSVLKPDEIQAVAEHVKSLIDQGKAQ